MSRECQLLKPRNQFRLTWAFLMRFRWCQQNERLRRQGVSCFNLYPTHNEWVHRWMIPFFPPTIHRREPDYICDRPRQKPPWMWIFLFLCESYFFWCESYFFLCFPALTSADKWMLKQWDGKNESVCNHEKEIVKLDENTDKVNKLKNVSFTRIKSSCKWRMNG